MSQHNPTALRVGATGAFHGWRVTVAGRVVLSVEIDGETYYWNEFNLVSESGNDGTLVFEETEQGPEWKLFRMFEPQRPMSLAEATTKKVGDTVSLDGTPNRITLVDASRVVHIEGTPPEGVQLGDVAHYFNVDTGRRMLVASWTGDEIEFYEGEDVPASLVASAFGLPQAALNSGSASTDRSNGGAQSRRSPAKTIIVIAMLVLVTVVALIVIFSSGSRRRTGAASGRSQAVAAPVLPPLQLTTGAQGRLGGDSLVLVGSATVEVARVKGRQHRREYQLSGDDGAPRFLVQGLTGGAREWHLLKPIEASPSLDPYEAARQRQNAKIMVNGQLAQVSELFLAKVLTKEGMADSLPAAGAVRYGFLARIANDWVVARWDEAGVQFHSATPFAENDVLAAFVGPEARAKK